MTKPPRFTVAEISRAIRSAEKAGLGWLVRIGLDGAIEIHQETRPEPVKPPAPRAPPGPDDMLLLATALERANLHGVMNLSQLRRRVNNGHLVAYRIAGKIFTTLNHIAEMRRMVEDPLPRTPAQRHGALRAVAAMQAYNAREDAKRRDRSSKIAAGDGARAKARLKDPDA